MVVVITGSSKGIGFHLAESFLQKGHSVVINGRNSDSLQDAQKKLDGFASDLLAIPGDVSKYDTHSLILEKSLDRFGQIDIWINNAGIPQPYLLFHKMDTKDIEDLVKVNVIGSLFGSRLTIDFFIKQGHGTLYNMEGFGSDGRKMKKLGLYGTSKRAMHYFTRSLKKEVKETNVKLGSINPGMVRTSFIEVGDNFDSKADQKQYEKVKRVLAEDPEKVCLWIADKIERNQKSFNDINYLSGWRLFTKISKLIIS